MKKKKFRVFKFNTTGLDYQKVAIVNMESAKVTAVLLNINGKTLTEVNDDVRNLYTTGQAEIPTVNNLYSKSDNELVELAYSVAEPIR